MIIRLMRGGEANCLATTGGSETKGLTTPGGVVPPSTVKMEPSCKLTIIGTNSRHYGKKTTFH